MKGTTEKHNWKKLRGKKNQDYFPSILPPPPQKKKTPTNTDSKQEAFQGHDTTRHKSGQSRCHWCQPVAPRLWGKTLRLQPGHAAAAAWSMGCSQAWHRGLAFAQWLLVPGQQYPPQAIASLQSLLLLRLMGRFNIRLSLSQLRRGW